MMTTLELAWLAGLLEGEGCFSHGGTSVSVKLAMTDFDVVTKAAKLMGGPVYGPYDRGPGRKDMFVSHINGQRAAAMMMSVWTLMCSRRRARIVQCLAIWRKQAINNRHKELCKRGHLLAGDNVRHYKQRIQQWNGRVCRTCQRMHQRNFKARRKLNLVSA